MAVGVLFLTTLAADPRVRARWPRVVVPAGVALAAVVLVSVPYLLARRDGTFGTVPPDFVRWGSARPGKTGTAGLAILGALALAPFWRRGVRGRVPFAWPVGLGLGGLACHLLALGPGIAIGAVTLPGPFALASRLVPGWDLVRSPFRLNAPATLAVSVFAGLGVAGLLRRLRGRRARAGAAAGAVGLALAITAATVPRRVVPAPVETRASLPPVYRWLATAPAGPVLELPFHDFRARGAGRGVEARRTYLSVYHWHPVLNAYSGYAPATYPAVSALVAALPDAEATLLLRRLTGLRWVVLHRDELDPAQRRRWRRAPRGLVPVAVFGADVVLAPRDLAPPDLQADFVAAGARRTPLGTARVTVPDRSRRGELSLPVEIAWRPWMEPAELAVDVTNRGADPWPALGAGSRGLVVLGHQWIDAQGRVVDERADTGRLPRDLAPGERVTARLLLDPPPGAAGPVRLRLGLAQDGTWFAGAIERCFAARGQRTPCPEGSGPAGGPTPGPG